MTTTPAVQQCRRVAFKELPSLAGAVAAYGMGELMLGDWKTGGHADGIPRFEPDPALGTREEFAAAIRRCHELGVKVTLLVNLQPVSRKHEWYRSELHRFACEDRWGVVATEMGWGSGSHAYRRLRRRRAPREAGHERRGYAANPCGTDRGTGPMRRRRDSTCPTSSAGRWTSIPGPQDAGPRKLGRGDRVSPTGHRCVQPDPAGVQRVGRPGLGPAHDAPPAPPLKCPSRAPSGWRCRIAGRSQSWPSRTTSAASTRPCWRAAGFA